MSGMCRRIRWLDATPPTVATVAAAVWRVPYYTFAMLRRIWLFFAQACTLCVAALFVVSTLRPDLLPRPAAVRPATSS